MAKPAQGETLKERKEDIFWRHAKKGKGCWEWTSAKLPKGYGTFCLQVNGKSKIFYAHRTSYEIHHGPIPDGMHVLHRCDNPPCANPAHIYLGTQADNAKDMIERGLHHSQSDEKQKFYDAIRYDYIHTPLTVEQLAKKYDASKFTIRNTIHLEHKHDDGPEDEERYRQVLARKKVLFNDYRVDGITALRIRKLYDTGNFSNYDMADMFGIDYTHASRIKNGERPAQLKNLDSRFLEYVMENIEDHDWFPDLSWGLR